MSLPGLPDGHNWICCSPSPARSCPHAPRHARHRLPWRAHHFHRILWKRTAASQLGLVRKPITLITQRSAKALEDLPFTSKGNREKIGFSLGKAASAHAWRLLYEYEMKYILCKRARVERVCWACMQQESAHTHACHTHTHPHTLSQALACPTAA